MEDHYILTTYSRKQSGVCHDPRISDGKRTDEKEEKYIVKSDFRQYITQPSRNQTAVSGLENQISSHSTGLFRSQTVSYVAVISL